MDTSELSLATRAVHVGSVPDPETGAVIPPIYQTSTFAQQAPGVPKKKYGLEYTRTHNPTRTHLEECLASLERAKFCLTTSSGLSACMLMMHLFPRGSRILCGDDLYGGTHRLFTTVFHKFHDFTFIDTTDVHVVKRAIEETAPRLLWLETPSNPLLKISDIEQIAGLCRANQSELLVDNTFATPVGQSPIDLGADFVLHSTTKYINGHSDVVGGAIVFHEKGIYDHLFTLQNSLGPCASPFDSWLIHRGVKTLSLRMQKHESNAMELARFLSKHQGVEEVIYPGLRSHPQHKVAKKQMKNFGGIVGLRVKGGGERAYKFLKALRLFTLAESLGGVESLAQHPATMTHASVPPSFRQKIGITDNFIRLSVGIEEERDLREDLQQALA